MNTDCLQEKIDLFLDSAPDYIREGTKDEQLEYLMSKAPIRNRIFPVLEATLEPFLQNYADRFNPSEPYPLEEIAYKNMRNEPCDIIGCDGHYGETEINDDWHGTLHCKVCNDCVDSRRVVEK